MFVTSLDVLLAQVRALSVFKSCCFLVLSDFLWQSVLGSAYSLCENCSSLSVLNSKLSAFIICFLFSSHKGWKKRDSQSIISWTVIILLPFITSLFPYFPIPSWLIAFQVQTPDFGDLLPDGFQAHLYAWSTVLGSFVLEEEAAALWESSAGLHGGTVPFSTLLPSCPSQLLTSCLLF